MSPFIVNLRSERGPTGAGKRSLGPCSEAFQQWAGKTTAASIATACVISVSKLGAGSPWDTSPKSAGKLRNRPSKARRKPARTPAPASYARRSLSTGCAHGALRHPVTMAARATLRTSTGSGRRGGGVTQSEPSGAARARAQEAQDQQQHQQQRLRLGLLDTSLGHRNQLLRSRGRLRRQQQQQQAQRRRRKLRQAAQAGRQPAQQYQ
jgi:hypothetical protein